MLAACRSRWTFANVVSLIALFVALSGSAYALTIPRNSVGAKHLKKNAVTGVKIKKNAVTSSKVRNGSLRVRTSETTASPGTISMKARSPRFHWPTRRTRPTRRTARTPLAVRGRARFRGVGL